MTDYPPRRIDKWIILKKPYTIYITQEWHKQKLNERHKRLIHELYHIINRNHWKKSKYISEKKLLEFWNINNLPLKLKPFLKNFNIELLYSTYPIEDSFSWYLYYCINFNKDYRLLLDKSTNLTELLLSLGGLFLFIKLYV